MAVRAWVIAILVVVFDFLALGCAWLSGNMLAFGEDGGTTHGAGDLLIPLIGGAIGLTALLLLSASILLAAFYPREAQWRGAIWTVPAASLLLSLFLFALS